MLFTSLGGCAGSGAVSTDPPRSLAEVNYVLAGKEARATLGDGTVVTGRGVAVFPDSVRFATGQPALSTARVSRTTYDRDRISPGAGAGGGALVGASVAVLSLLSSDEPGPLELVLGGVVIGGGALLGLLIGIAEQEGAQERVAYEEPLSRYEPARAEQ